MNGNMGERIRSARRARGLSMAELARLTHVTVAELSRYERGLASPGSDVLCRLAAALCVRPAHFLRPGRIEVLCIGPRLPRRLAKAVEWQVGEYLERYRAVEELLGVARHDALASLSSQINDLGDEERRAETLRRDWDLGLDPIANLTETLEDRGVKVVPVTNLPADLTAVACNADGQPVIAVSSAADVDGAGQRLAVARELGRLLPGDRTEVVSASAGLRRHFARALLVPRQAALAELGDRRSEVGYRELHSLKHRWGFGMLAWCDRLRDLGIIDASYHRRMARMFRSRGWEDAELGGPAKPERSLRFERLVHRAVAEDVIGLPRAADLLNRPLVEVRRESGWPNQ